MPERRLHGPRNRRTIGGEVQDTSKNAVSLKILQNRREEVMAG